MERFFSKSLFLEGMRQLKVLGIISAIISMLISFFTVYGMHISAKDVNMRNAATGFSNYIEEVGTEICLPIILVGWVVVPLAVFMLFNFMNKRNSSDFYHGIVQRRETLCLSFIAAILVLALAVMASSVIVGTLSTAIFPYVRLEKYFWSELLEGILKVIAVAIFWIGVILLSMSLSGTVLTNLAVTAIILFFPKVLYLVINGVVTGDIDIYPFNSGEGLLSGRYNLVTGVFNQIIDYNSSYTDNALLCILYTAGLGILFIIAGCVAFCLRKSEAATLAAPNRKLQMVFRIIPAFVVTMVPSVYLYNIILQNKRISEEDFFMILVFYVMAAVAYFLYEIITTKKWRNIWKSAPGLLVILLLDVVFIGVMFGRREMILAEQPRNSSYVRILGTRMSDMNSKDYFQLRSAEVKITDPRAIEILEDNLAQDVQLIRNNERSLSYERSRYLVEFRDNGKSTYRLVFVNKAETAYLDGVIANTKTMTALTDLLDMKISKLSIGQLTEDSETNKRLLQAYIEEIQQKPKQYADILLARDSYNSEPYMEEIDLQVTYNGRICNLDLPIFYSMDFAETYVQEYNREVRINSSFSANPKTDGKLTVFVYEPIYGNSGTAAGYSRYRYATIDETDFVYDTEKGKAYDAALSYLQGLEGGKIITENGFVLIKTNSNQIGRYYPLDAYGMSLLKMLESLN